MVKTMALLDESSIRAMSVKARFDTCSSILKNEKDESLRWDAVYLGGEIAEVVGPNNPLFGDVADLMSWVLEHDDNQVVKHEACYQIAARNMRKKIPDLIKAALHDKTGLVRHEAIESLGLMNAFDSPELVFKSLRDPVNDVKITAEFVIKRLQRAKSLLGRDT